MAELKNVAPLADFDWNAYESGDTLVNESREAQEKGLRRLFKQSK